MQCFYNNDYTFSEKWPNTSVFSKFTPIIQENNDSLHVLKNLND
jgi:hypothetical protein